MLTRWRQTSPSSWWNVTALTERPDGSRRPPRRRSLAAGDVKLSTRTGPTLLGRLVMDVAEEEVAVVRLAPVAGPVRRQHHRHAIRLHRVPVRGARRHRPNRRTSGSRTRRRPGCAGAPRSGSQGDRQRQRRVLVVIAWQKRPPRRSRDARRRRATTRSRPGRRPRRPSANAHRRRARGPLRAWRSSGRSGGRSRRGTASAPAEPVARLARQLGVAVLAAHATGNPVGTGSGGDTTPQVATCSINSRCPPILDSSRAAETAFFAVTLQSRRFACDLTSKRKRGLGLARFTSRPTGHRARLYLARHGA